MIKRFVLWYLRKVALAHCKEEHFCSCCSFGYENCRCAIQKVQEGLREMF